MKKIFAANWKMHLNIAESTELAEGLFEDFKDASDVEFILCPSFTSLLPVHEIIKDSNIQLGAQDMSWLDKSSLTGEISVSMLKEVGVTHVIVGHSERRHQLGENDEMVNLKLQAVLRAGLTPILCVGETFEERQEGRKDFVISGQVESALKNIALHHKQIIIAYEPVWVIGSGQAVKLDEAEHAARVIKQVLIDLYPQFDFKSQLKILYGGSVDSKNVKDFTKSDLISGVLVGGASMNRNEVSAMVKQMKAR